MEPNRPCPGNCIVLQCGASVCLRLTFFFLCSGVSMILFFKLTDFYRPSFTFKNSLILGNKGGAPPPPPPFDLTLSFDTFEVSHKGVGARGPKKTILSLETPNILSLFLCLSGFPLGPQGFSDTNMLVSATRNTHVGGQAQWEQFRVALEY